ncbi:Arm DNA-binding domain-containing protein [Bradyrhizobium sp. SZCCHNRI20481]|uniref:Arm DNA-binding domain-containing protein n=1 Tax=Bradyrhizobium sp. SZCCHNRI20481 TaxID=3057286 RepID=UPI002915D035|nr:Arm DNA-binding domain-containing protein [Bradyrhizobium sp. SZCCHNRI20481]
MPAKSAPYFRHLKPAAKDDKRSNEGGLFMLVTATGLRLWRFAYRYDGKQKLLAT